MTDIVSEPQATPAGELNQVPMAGLDEKTLDAIITSLGKTPSEAECLARLKSAWPNVRFIFCDDDDLGEKEPFWQCEHFTIHLMAASLGCATFTRLPEHAAGVVIGIIED